MNIIKIRHPYQSEQIPEDDVVLVLGFFDGVHIGHQKVIKTGMEIAQKEGLKLALMTFNQHPSIVFKKIDPSSVKYLTSLKQKEEKMAALGIDYLYEVDFTSSFAHLAPQEFVDQYIVGLHAKYAVLIIRMDQKTLQMSLIFLNMPKEDSKSSQFLKKKNKVKKSALPVFEDY